MKKLVIFDLDGTLLNTIADLAQSTNYVLKKLGFPVHMEEAYNFMVGNGINKLFERALPEGEKTEENIVRVRKEFLIYYNEHNTDKSRPYPGIVNLLKNLRENNIMIAVASNKYHEATLKLVGYYFSDFDFMAVLGQREGINPKPDPGIVLEIMEKAGLTRSEILYVGDSGVDMQTAKNSCVTACGATWGFRPRNELEAFKPDMIVDRAGEIWNYIKKENLL